MNTKTLCQSVVDTANSRCPPLVHKAEFVKKTFEKVLHLFSQCREVYDTSKILDDRDIGMLGMIPSIQWVLFIIRTLYRGQDRQIPGVLQGKFP